MLLLSAAPPPFCTRRLPQSPPCRCPCCRALAAFATCCRPPRRRPPSPPSSPPRLPHRISARPPSLRRSRDGSPSPPLRRRPRRPRDRRPHSGAAAPPAPSPPRCRRSPPAPPPLSPRRCLSRPPPAILLPTAMPPPPASANMPSPPPQPPPSTSPHRRRTRRRAATLAGRPQCRRTMRGVIGSCLVTAQGSQRAVQAAALHGAATGAQRHAAEGGGARAVVGEMFVDSAGPRRMQVAVARPRRRASRCGSTLRWLDGRSGQ